MSISFPPTLDRIDFVGSDLHRPECVLCTRAGDIFASDRRGGVAHITPAGTQKLYIGSSADLSTPLFPNGIAMDRDGSFLVAHLDENEGGVFRLARDGQVTPVLQEADGVRFTTTNFVLLDEEGRIWVTISTRRIPRDLAYRSDACDGFIVLIDAAGARIVADDLGFANEIRIDRANNWLYVNETYARRLTRFRLLADGRLSDRQSVVEFGPGVFPDGLALDVEGGIWVTSVVSNRLIRVMPDGRHSLFLEDSDRDHVAQVEAAYQAGEMGRSHIDTITARVLKSLSSIAFGGPDLRTAYLGVLLGSSLPRLSMPVAGVPLAHWEF